MKNININVFVLCVISIIFSTSTSYLHAKTIVKNLVSDFGAIANDTKNDHKAFELAVRDFKNKKNDDQYILIIPQGNYIIGKQLFKASGQFYQGVDVLPIVECSNITIQGQGKVVLRYENNMKFGAFDPITNKSTNSQSSNYNYQHRADIGHAISVIRSRNVKINNLTIDGNCLKNKIILGGTWGDIDRQCIHYGIGIYYSRSVHVDSVISKNFGTDGFIIKTKHDDSSQNHVSLRNCISDGNCRQGLSIVGANHVSIVKCTFKNTGMGLFNSQPSAGIDLEPEMATVNGQKLIYKNCNILIDSCLILNNRQSGILGNSGAAYNMNITVKNTTIADNRWESISINGHQFNFINCKIYGGINGLVRTDVANGANDGTYFDNCTFSDEYQGNKQWVNPYINSSSLGYNFFFTSQYEIDKKGMGYLPVKNLQFNNCVFDMKHHNGIFYLIWGNAGQCIIDRCRFTLSKSCNTNWTCGVVSYLRNFNLTNTSFDLPAGKKVSHETCQESNVTFNNR